MLAYQSYKFKGGGKPGIRKEWLEPEQHGVSVKWFKEYRIGILRKGKMMKRAKRNHS